jgi:hypothetical protein
MILVIPLEAGTSKVYREGGGKSAFPRLDNASNSVTSSRLFPARLDRALTPASVPCGRTNPCVHRFTESREKKTWNRFDRNCARSLGEAETARLDLCELTLGLKRLTSRLSGLVEGSSESE